MLNIDPYMCLMSLQDLESYIYDLVPLVSGIWLNIHIQEMRNTVYLRYLTLGS